MTLDPHRTDLAVGVVGAGTMGRGIAQVAATGAMRVVLADARAGAAADAKSFIASMLDRAVEKGTMTPQARSAALDRIEVVDTLAPMRGCHLAIEAIVEDLGAKQQLLGELESVVGDDCILATNTSSLSVTAIGSKLRRPERFAGFHFFNPVPLLKLVEVIEGVRSASWVAEALAAVGRRMGREPVRLQDSPGFLVNQLIRGLTLEGAHIAAEGIASFVEIDRIMRDVAGFRMGPFELMDLTGLDVTQPASIAIYEQHYHEPRYRPTQLMQSRYAGGILGRKTGSGFYEYREGKAVVPADPPTPPARPAATWVSPADLRRRAAIVQLLEKLGVRPESGERPSDQALILVTPVGSDATTTAVSEGLDARRTLAVDTLFPLTKRRTLMTTPLTEPAFRDAAHGLLGSDGIPVSVIADSPGFVAQRVVAMIVNLGCALANSHTASPADIDKGALLGLNLPHGPLAFGDALGAPAVLRVLDAVAAHYGDPRYRPSPWLSRRVKLGMSLLSAARC